MLKIRIAAAAILMLLPGELLACGGGGSFLRDFINNTVTIENAYNIASETGGIGSSVLGTAVGTVNGMLFTLAGFFSDKSNVQDFGSGLKAIRNLNAANQQVDRSKVGGGAMGKPSDMTIQDFESLF